MIDPHTLAERRAEIEESCRKRGVAVDVDALVRLHGEVTALVTEQNETNRRRNEHQKSGKRKMSDEEREAHVAQGRAFKDELAAIEDKLRDVQARFDEALGAVPNLTHPDVPAGGEEDFAVLQEGKPTSFDFEPLDHLAISDEWDLVDFENAARVAGQKFYYLKNEAALLEVALQRFALDVLLEEGFTPVVTPDLARPDVVQGLGFNPKGEETQIYSIDGHDLCLVGTAEITLGGLHANHIFDEHDLPLRLAGISHCFRTEAGAHGRESRGLYRVHQFTKTEMFVFCKPEQSEEEHANLRRIEEKIFDALEVPYRVIDVAAGDLGSPAYRKFDLEAWMPGRGEGGDWGEITSTSNCTDYQARRLKIRFRREGSKKNELVHTLNGTAISNARAILALLENHQQADGTVKIPDALQPWVGRGRIGPR